MEQTLGHRVHDQNFRPWIKSDPDVAPTWFDVPFDAPDRWARTPVVKSNWTLRASLRAMDQVRAALRTGPLDGLFFHTQVTALFAQRLMKQIPTVVSLDATPLNFDSIGSPYNHAPSRSSQVEALKNALNRRTFRMAAKLVAWCDWAKQSLIRDYGVDAAKIAVIPPGIDLSLWQFSRELRGERRVIRLLFVGGDFRRKGGEILLRAFREELAGACELDIVTREEVDVTGLSGVRVHHGVAANAPALRALYASADVFVFPTFGDTRPLVVMEAMASGLPVVSTSVGAIDEEVEPGVTGLLVAPGDHQALSEAVLKLVADPELRHKMGIAGRQAAERLFDASRNYRELLAVCKSCVDAR